jgi:hypothetical protein
MKFLLSGLLFMIPVLMSGSYNSWADTTIDGLIEQLKDKDVEARIKAAHELGAG